MNAQYFGEMENSLCSTNFLRFGRLAQGHRTYLPFLCSTLYTPKYVNFLHTSYMHTSCTYTVYQTTRCEMLCAIFFSCCYSLFSLSLSFLSNRFHYFRLNFALCPFISTETENAPLFYVMYIWLTTLWAIRVHSRAPCHFQPYRKISWSLLCWNMPWRKNSTDTHTQRRN